MSINDTLHGVTTEAVSHASVLPQDQAAVGLALRYAWQIDGDPELLDSLGPKLLATLSALGMTPAGRGAKGVSKDATPVVNKLDELAQRRANRAG